MSRGIPNTKMIHAARAAVLVITKLKYQATATHTHSTITTMKKNIRLWMFLIEIDSWFISLWSPIVIASLIILYLATIGAC